MSDALVMLFPTKALQPSRLLWIFQDFNFAAFLSSSFADEQKLSVKAFCLSLSLSLSCMLPSKTSIATDMFSLFSILLHHLTDDFHFPFSFAPLPNHGPGHCMSISLLFAVATVCFAKVTCQVAIGVEKSKGDPARTGGSGGYPGRMHARSR